jgi:hypothetical protein
VAFVPYVSAALAAPVSSDPDGSRMRGALVGSADPDIVATVPAVVAGNPDEAGTGGGDDLDGARRGWSDADDKLGVRDSGSYGEEKSRCGDEEILADVHYFLLGVSDGVDGGFNELVAVDLARHFGGNGVGWDRRYVTRAGRTGSSIRSVCGTDV